MHEPYCVFSCKSILAECRLTCSTLDDDNPEVETSLECFASDDAFLQSLALCIDSRCGNVNTWDIENFWVIDAVGDKSHQPEPKYSYQEALCTIEAEPTSVIGENEILEAPGLLGGAEGGGVERSLLFYEGNGLGRDAGCEIWVSSPRGKRRDPNS
jgi:hypothetical protein